MSSSRTAASARGRSTPRTAPSIPPRRSSVTPSPRRRSSAVCQTLLHRWVSSRARSPLSGGADVADRRVLAVHVTVPVLRGSLLGRGEHRGLVGRGALAEAVVRSERGTLLDRR